jgi:NAD(P)-dependent dehydrogenase (short-subunit alcohol dehydrogenase family)
MVQLKGMRVAITGGARGIGLATAEALIAAGCRVALGDVHEDAVKESADNVGALGYHLDVVDPVSFDSFLDRVAAELGEIDVLINNAGIMPIGPFLDEDPNVTRRTLEINLMGVMIGTRLAGDRFMQRRSGHVINIASVMGTLASPNAATYCAVKYGVVGFSAALRQEWRGSGVKVSAICPGFVRTELIAGMSAPAFLEPFLMVHPEDVAAAVVREVAAGKSRTVFVPELVGLVARASTVIPTPILDMAFRLTGGHRVTSDHDRAERAAYQARVEGKE